MSYKIVADINNVASMCTYDENTHSDRHDEECHLVEVNGYTDANGVE
jgi:hypothetical protein